MNANEMNEMVILQRIGARMREIRLEQNLKQKDLAEKSGLSMFSISQMETGHNTSVQSLVQVLRALDRLDMIEPFLREKQVDAEALARFIQSQQSTRRRVSRVQAGSGSPTITEDTLIRDDDADGGQRPVSKPYFLSDDDDEPMALVADDSDVE